MKWLYIKVRTKAQPSLSIKVFEHQNSTISYHICWCVTHHIPRKWSRVPEINFAQFLQQKERMPRRPAYLPMQQIWKDLIGRYRLLNRPVTGPEIYSPIISQLSSLMGLSGESYSKKWKVLHQWHVSVHSVRSIDWNCSTLSHEQVQTRSNSRTVREIQLTTTAYWTKGWI